MHVRFPRSVERAVARALLGLPSPLLRRLVGPPYRSPDGLTLDLQLQTLLWLIARLKVPSFATGDVARARAELERAAPTLDVPPARDVAAYDRVIPLEGRSLQARVYTPPGTRGASPGLVYFHGGGWVVGSIEMADRVCRAIASRAGVVVVSIEYRLAPEHRFPAAHDDAVDATRWVLDHAATLGMDASAVAVGGDSAGGQLSAVACIALRGAPRKPAFQLLVYPGTDMTRSLPSHRHFREGYFLSEEAITWYRGHYVPDPSLYEDPRASPLFAPDVKGVPPALVITCGFDPLRDEGRAYAEKLRAAGIDAEHVCFEGMMHGVLMLGAALRDGNRMIDLAADRLRVALARRRAN